MKHCRTYADNYNYFAGTLLREAAGSADKQNVVVSPLSVITALCLTARAAGGRTREEILSCISGGQDLDDTIGAIREITAKAERTGELKNANAVGVAEKIGDKINEDFIRSLKEDFSGELFASADLTCDVNSWVNEHTNGMIDKLLDGPAGNLSTCIMNAVAFDAEWEKQYGDGDISEDEFTNADGSVTEVEMLRSREEVYIENDSCTGFIKPYKGCDYSFMALLPKHKTGSFMTHDLQTLNFANLFKSCAITPVIVSIPEFKFTYGGDISDICRSLGIEQAFTTAADFSPMTSEWVMVDSIIHKAHIELDRKGTKAAAATAVMVAVATAPGVRYEIKTVCLDRPFVFAIMNNETRLPIFTGVVNHL